MVAANMHKHRRLGAIQAPANRVAKDSPILVAIVLGLLAATLLWPGYGEWKLSGIPNIAPPRLLKLAFFGWLAYRFAWTGLPLQRLRQRIVMQWGIFTCLAIYELFQLIAIVLDPNWGYFLYGFIKEEVFSNLLLMFAILLVFRDEVDIRRAVEIVSLAGLVIGILVGVESVLKENLFARVVSDVNLGTAFAMLDKSRDLSYRAQGPFSHPLLLATFCAGALPLCWWSIGVTRGLRRIAHLLAFVALLASAYLSHTRSGLAVVALVLGLCAVREYLVWLRRCRNQVFGMLTLTAAIGLFAVVLGLAGWFGWQILVGRTFEEAMSSHVRWQMLSAGIPKIFASPLVGYGPTNSGAQAGFTNVMFGGFVDIYFLAIGLRMGVIGLLAYIGLYLVTLATALKSWRTSSGKSLAFFLALAVLGQLLMQAVHALSDLIGFLFVLIAMIVVRAETRAEVPATHLGSAAPTISQDQFFISSPR